jgi:hypothetical protein
MSDKFYIHPTGTSVKGTATPTTETTQRDYENCLAHAISLKKFHHENS